MENQINISPLNPLKGTLRRHEASFKGLTKMSNILLIAGNGRNVGKTTFACKIIQYLSVKKEVVGLKISPHFHEYNESDVIIKNNKFVITEETKINSKDSSLMLQAGAKKVYFVMVKPEHIEEAVEHLIQVLPSKFVVCESGGMRESVLPGLFFMVKRREEEIVKTHLIKYSPIIVNNDGENFDFDIQNIDFQNKKFNLKQ